MGRAFTYLCGVAWLCSAEAGHLQYDEQQEDNMTSGEDFHCSTSLEGMSSEPFKDQCLTCIGTQGSSQLLGSFLPKHKCMLRVASTYWGRNAHYKWVCQRFEVDIANTASTQEDCLLATMLPEHQKKKHDAEQVCFAASDTDCESCLTASGSCVWDPRDRSCLFEQDAQAKEENWRQRQVARYQGKRDRWDEFMKTELANEEVPKYKDEWRNEMDLPPTMPGLSPMAKLVTSVDQCIGIEGRKASHGRKVAFGSVNDGITEEECCKVNSNTVCKSSSCATVEWRGRLASNSMDPQVFNVEFAACADSDAPTCHEVLQYGHAEKPFRKRKVDQYKKQFYKGQLQDAPDAEEV